MAFSAAQNRSKRTGGAMDDSVINAHACGKQFDGSKRLQNDELWAAYSTGKQTAVGKALWRLTLTLKDCHKVTFQSALQAWFEQHEGFLNERTVNEETGNSHYAQDAEKRVFEPETEPGLPVYLWGLSRFWHPQHHQFTGWALCRLKAQVGRYYEMKRENKVIFIKDYFVMSDDE